MTAVLAESFGWSQGVGLGAALFGFGSAIALVLWVIARNS